MNSEIQNPADKTSALRAALERPRRDWNVFASLLPSSTISLCVHVLILILASVSLRGCESGVPVEAGGENFRDVGLAVVPDSSDAETAVPEQNPSDVPEERPAEPITETQPTDILPPEPPTMAELLGKTSPASDTASTAPLELPPIIGPGTPIAGSPSQGMPPQIRPPGTSGQGRSGSPTPGKGETKFMNIIDGGRSFVYVIDSSSSMAEGQRMDLAKSQLKASLQMLRPGQSFQVLFYNESTTQMKLRRQAPQDLYPATTICIQLADDEIDRITPSAGTEHLSPILHALRLEPDVIYFLTDGDQPRLSTQGANSDLAKISRANRAGTRIHVTEFGNGSRETRQVSWLELLAHQSGGQYQYIAVR